jgi:hypothetical protein
MECVIRRINRKRVWYLHSYDVEWNNAKWTKRFHKAHLFKNEEEAKDFTRIFLGEDRARECDTFSEYETWSI